MRRAAVTLAATVVGLVLLLSYKTHNPGTTALRPGALAPTTPQPTPAGGPSTPTQPSSTAATRTVYGQPFNTRYGPVQVRVTERGGHILSVDPVQLPEGTGRDIQIDNFAVPQLIQETLDTQSARIDMVSGATFTSEGYIASLQSALDRF